MSFKLLSKQFFKIIFLFFLIDQILHFIHLRSVYRNLSFCINLQFNIYKRPNLILNAQNFNRPNLQFKIKLAIKHVQRLAYLLLLKFRLSAANFTVDFYLMLTNAKKITN